MHFCKDPKGGEAGREYLSGALGAYLSQVVYGAVVRARRGSCSARVDSTCSVSGSTASPLPQAAPLAATLCSQTPCPCPLPQVSDIKSHPKGPLHQLPRVLAGIKAGGGALTEEQEQAVARVVWDRRPGQGAHAYLLGVVAARLEGAPVMWPGCAASPAFVLSMEPPLDHVPTYGRIEQCKMLIFPRRAWAGGATPQRRLRLRPHAQGLRTGGPAPLPPTCTPCPRLTPAPLALLQLPRRRGQGVLPGAAGQGALHRRQGPHAAGRQAGRAAAGQHPRPRAGPVGVLPARRLGARGLRPPHRGPAALVAAVPLSRPPRGPLPRCAAWCGAWCAWGAFHRSCKFGLAQLGKHSMQQAQTLGDLQRNLALLQISAGYMQAAQVQDSAKQERSRWQAAGGGGLCHTGGTGGGDGTRLACTRRDAAFLVHEGWSRQKEQQGWEHRTNSRCGLRQARLPRLLGDVVAAGSCAAGRLHQDGCCCCCACTGQLHRQQCCPCSSGPKK